jgi:hypothetical protein
MFISGVSGVGTFDGASETVGVALLAGASVFVNCIITSKVTNRMMSKIPRIRLATGDMLVFINYS